MAGFVPFVGEALDIAVLLDPDSSLFELAAASASLAVNMVLPVAPNFGAVARAGRLAEQGRDALGRFLPKRGGDLIPGSIAEREVLDAIRRKPGFEVTAGRVSVRDSTGQLRVFDGAVRTPRGRYIGIEVKSGAGRRTALQRAFDIRLNSRFENRAFGVGQSKEFIVDRVLLIQR